MPAIMCCAIVLASSVLGADGPVKLRESGRVGQATRVQVELKAEGLYLPAAPQGAGKEQTPRPLALKVEAQLDFFERWLKVDDQGQCRRALRKVVRAASAVNGEVRPSAAALRPEVALLVAEPGAEGVVVFSPAGPLKRSELELVQGPGDPLAWSGLLPDREVKVGDRWKIGDPAVKSLTSYDTLIASTLEGILDSVEADVVKAKLVGEVRGSVLGGVGTMACDGSFTFDRADGRVDGLTLRRAENRRPGPVEEGLDVKSTLTVKRRAAEFNDDPPGTLTPDPATPTASERERLLLDSPDGKYTLRHDRDWHTYWDDPRLVVLKRIEGGRLVAQCNLATGPSAGPGRPQDPSQFRDDVRKGLGSRFTQFLGAGELAGDSADGFRYKVGVQGRQGDLGIIWYYYLVASPAGDQILATFTLVESQAKAFGDEDEALIGSLRWKDQGAVRNPAERRAP
ncbi:MAG: hypothetical protein NVSMB9_25730 [Isosphaeraceae bacterium]